MKKLTDNFLLFLPAKSFFTFLALLHMCFFPKMLWAETIQPRLPQQEDVEKFQRDPVFNYEQAPQGESFFERFMRWFFRQLGMQNGESIDNIILVLFVILVIVLIYFIFRSEISSVFYKSSSSTIKMKTLEEDINEIDFDKAINDSIARKNYRYAIRMYYLKNLKLLHDNGYIKWEINKTNQDYLQELHGKNIHGNFSGITSLFNWIWYGDFPLAEDEFQNMKEEFVRFGNQISTQA